MKNKILLSALLSVAACVGQASAQTTAFTYQGKLTDSGSPATGLYDLLFRLFDTPTEGNMLGYVISMHTPVTNGLFTVSLDFGSGPFTGPRRWMETDIRT